MNFEDLFSDNIKEICKYLNVNDLLSFKISHKRFDGLIDSVNLTERITYLFKLMYENINSFYKYYKYIDEFICWSREKNKKTYKLNIGILETYNLRDRFKSESPIRGVIRLKTSYNNKYELIKFKSIIDKDLVIKFNWFRAYDHIIYMYK